MRNVPVLHLTLLRLSQDQIEIEMKKARSVASGLYDYVEPGADYGSLCGDVVMVLNEQLTCGTEPTKDVA